MTSIQMLNCTLYVWRVQVPYIQEFPKPNCSEDWIANCYQVFVSSSMIIQNQSVWDNHHYRQAHFQVWDLYKVHWLNVDNLTQLIYLPHRIKQLLPWIYQSVTDKRRVRHQGNNLLSCIGFMSFGMYSEIWLHVDYLLCSKYSFQCKCYPSIYTWRCPF